jgi:phenylacetate-CoA ligase
MIRPLTWTAVMARHHPGWRARLREVRRVAGLSAEAFAAWHSDRVAEHVAWATSQVPWWRERAPGARRLDELPVLARRDVQAGREALRDPARDPASLLAEASGGSTGEPVRTYTDAAAQAAAAATDVWVQASWGVGLSDRRAFLWGDDRERPSRRERLRDQMLGIRLLNAFRMDAARMTAFADELAVFRPRLVVGYASALVLFAEFLLAEGRRDVRPAVVRSAAEALSPERRRTLESAFGCPVRDFYGSRESPCLAAECREGALHVLAHGRVVEVVDERGRASPPGVPGRVLVTDLENRAFGLLRYENGDVASLALPGPCACACPYPRLERVHGRTSDFLTTPRGERVHGEWFTHLFYGVEGVERFQVRQRDLATVDLLTVGAAGEERIAPLVARMRARLGDGVTVTWQRVEQIPSTPSGKHRFTVSDVPFEHVVS